MPGAGGPRVILGVGFWAQQEYFGILPGPDGTKIFRPILKSLPDQPPPPNAFQSWTWSYNLNLIGQDRLPTGEQIFDLVPSQKFPPEQVQLHSWRWSYNLNLIGKDRMLVGEQVYDLTPSQRPPEQIQLHAWQWSYNLNLIGKDRMAAGEQLYDRPTLPIP